ncbi:MAG: helix-turn-helix domain-containing protein [Alicyclobacillus sp.]|nr:helix-turn-helix domain-containing protein [Alicyclobacillus sp.]
MKIVLKDANAFKRLLLVKGYTQRGLGRAIGIAEAYATQISSGTRNPGPEIARKIVDLLQVEFDDIFFIDDACKSNQANDNQYLTQNEAIV